VVAATKNLSVPTGDNGQPFAARTTQRQQRSDKTPAATDLESKTRRVANDAVLSSKNIFGAAMFYSPFISRLIVEISLTQRRRSACSNAMISSGGQLK
jgi:hypothetical protein